jgi:coproporphyrinogen III oxidase-like Fe-S oxidoreductase
VEGGGAGVTRVVGDVRAVASAPVAAPSPLGVDGVLDLISPGALARTSKRLLVYVHVPFCATKCHFCDWVVGYDKRELLDAGDLRSRYVDALCAQIEAYAPRFAGLGYTVTNVYWGGGTPTRLSPEQLRRVRETLQRSFDLSQVGEHTAECSPETVTEAHLEELLAGGLNRISVGVQSFDDEVLLRMGRAHDARAAVQALELFERVGLENHNIDLITGFPDQSADSVLASVRQTVDLGVPHVSLYMFREFAQALVAVRQVASGKRTRVSREERAVVYRSAKAMLEAAGYKEYVVGYFAREPRFRFDGESYYFGMAGDFVGFGAGASSALGRCAIRSGEASRYGAANVRSFLERPLDLLAAPLALMPDSFYIDVAFKAFAMPEGLQFDRWRDHFGFTFPSFRAARPGIARWFREQEVGGARFVESEDAIALTPDTWVETMLWRR